MLKKISDNPVDYESDVPKQDFKCFENAMKQIVKAAPIKKNQQDRGKIASK
jgi:hypothetical protein